MKNPALLAGGGAIGFHNKNLPSAKFLPLKYISQTQNQLPQECRKYQ
jgi:hypothetical protein